MDTLAQRRHPGLTGNLALAFTAPRRGGRAR